MHGFIRNRLEDLLAAERPAAEQEDQTGHFASCSECASELKILKAQSEMLRLLRVPEELEPSAGFYARVLQRIEERARESVWAALIYSPLSSRIAYVSLTLALVAGSYVIAAEARDGHLTGSSIVAEVHYDAPVVGSPSQQRDAVLENFASH
jgi:predicted anti-sigma-YlaC factor YlaD